MARRRYQKGTLMLRGKREKVWVGRWLEDQWEGSTLKRIRKSVVLGSAKDLTKKLAQRELDKHISHVNAVGYKPSHKLTFRDLAEKWKNSVLPTHKPSSQDSERAHITHLCSFFGELDARQITSETVQRFASQMLQTHRPKTVRNMLITFRLVWKASFDWGYVEHDERRMLRGVRVVDNGLKQVNYFEPDQARAIISAAKEPFKTMFWIVAETGIRGGELVALGLEDVDLEHRIIRVRRSAWCGVLQTPKTANAVRTFAISQKLADHIRHYRDTDWRQNEAGLLFVTKKGTVYNNNDVVSDVLHPIIDRLGYVFTGRIGLHALRHGNATLLDRKQVPIATRKARLGHASFQTTMGYTHAVSADDRNIAEELGDLFDPTCPTSAADAV